MVSLPGASCDMPSDGLCCGSALLDSPDGCLLTIRKSLLAFQIGLVGGVRNWGVLNAVISWRAFHASIVLGWL